MRGVDAHEGFDCSSFHLYTRYTKQWKLSSRKKIIKEVS